MNPHEPIEDAAATEVNSPTPSGTTPAVSDVWLSFAKRQQIIADIGGEVDDLLQESADRDGVSDLFVEQWAAVVSGMLARLRKDVEAAMAEQARVRHKIGEMEKQKQGKEQS